MAVGFGNLIHIYLCHESLLSDDSQSERFALFVVCPFGFPTILLLGFVRAYSLLLGFYSSEQARLQAQIRAFAHNFVQ